MMRYTSITNLTLGIKLKNVMGPGYEKINLTSNSYLNKKENG
jgi:hypothetical protein